MKQYLERVTQYLTTQNTTPDSRFVEVGLIASAAFFILGMMAPMAVTFLKTKRRIRQDQLIRSISIIARIAGAIWFVLFFLRFEDVRPFDMRIWVYLVLIPTVIAIIMTVMRYRKTIPIQMKENTRKEHYDKYLPKAKVK